LALADAGQNVLLVDLAGKQGDLGKHFGVWERIERIAADEAWPNISTVFDDSWSAIAEKLGPDAVSELIVETDEGVDLIPAHPGLDTLDADLGTIDDARERYSRFDQFLNTYIDPLEYDIILIDLPGLTNNVSYNGLWAARNVILPVEMGPFEAKQAAALREDIAKINDRFTIDISVVLVMPNKVDTRTTLGTEYLEGYTDAYPNAIAPAYVPYSQDIRNAAEQGQTAFALDRPSTTATTAREAYRQAAEAMRARLHEQQPETDPDTEHPHA